MKRPTILSFIFIVLLSISSHYAIAQKKSLPDGAEYLTPISEKDSIGLTGLPKLTMPEWLKGSNKLTLPMHVDNSEQACWRPVFAQSGLECGQASGVALSFTYGINRLRDLPSNVPENQYPAYFTWNWAHGGEGWYGVSYFHSYEVLRTVGNPTVEVYGGMTQGGPERWMTGYDNYYHSMHNRINQVYQIDLSNEDGINTLRNWIHNNLEGSDIGGVATFYTNAPYGMQTLPSGTPEEGLYVVTGWSSANHGLTICAYHDSICWDYNNDGQYTNNIDINNDGKVNVRDWEVGGFRFANTYSGGPSFGNDGFSYMTYKSCADAYGSGGIWNNAAHVLYSRESTEPLLTAKITLRHNRRNAVGVKMGFSTDMSAEYPDFVVGYPIFDHQGGNFFMQGGSTVEDQTIEFGLDLSPFLNQIPTGTPVRYFLLVDEDAPGWGDGDMISYAIMDYTDGVEEIVCEESNVPLTNNGLSVFWVDHTVEYESVNITTDTLPEATVYEPYSEALLAEGGSTPYSWDFDMNYTETESSGVFPTVSNENLTPGNTNDGYTIKELDFSFPFHGVDYDEIRVHVDGYMTFEDLLESWPYQVFDQLIYQKNKFVSVFHSDLKLNAGDGIWYAGNENSAIFRWKASVNSNPDTEINFAVELFPSGDIKYYFGEDNTFPSAEWFSGISGGNSKNYQFTNISGHNTIPVNHIIDLKATHYPAGFSISPAGQLTGTALQNYDEMAIKFIVTDESLLTHSKEVYFSTDGANYLVVKDYSVLAGNDDIIEFGETVMLSVTIENLGMEVITDVDIQISSDDEFLTLIDTTAFLGTFDPGQVSTFENIFSFDVSTAIENGHNIDLNTLILDDSGNDWASHIFLIAYAPEISVSALVVEDGGLDPGETADLIATFNNSGGAGANNVNITMSTADPYITVNDSYVLFDELNSGENAQAVFNVTAANDVPLGYIAELLFETEADNDYFTTDVSYITCGLLYEGFESGNFDSFPWSFNGEAPWLIDNGISYEGAYSAKSGDIEDEESSSMELNFYVLSDGDISFYKKVSSENNYDYLHFYINGIEKDAWAGEVNWSQASYPISAGLNTFTWSFEKDYSVSNGSDCAWVDNIIIPPYGDQFPQLTVGPEDFMIDLDTNIVYFDSVFLNNQGSGPVIYEIDAVDLFGNSIDWISIENTNGGLNPEQELYTAISFDATNLEDGVYEGVVNVTDHMSNVYEIPFSLTLDIINVGVDEQDLIVNNKCIPNPFKNTTQIHFSLKQTAHTTVDIFNAQGTMVNSLLSSSKLLKGNNAVSWDGKNNEGSKVPNGLYYYRIMAGNSVITGKVLLYN